MGQIARALAMEETIEYKGKPYKLAPLTMEVMGRWEMWLQQRAWDAIDRKWNGRRNKDGDLTPQQEADYREDKDTLARSIVAGDYDFFSQTSLSAQQGWYSGGSLFSPGARQMAMIRLKVNHPEVDDALILEIAEAKADEIREKTKVMDADPNRSSASAAKVEEAAPAPTAVAA